MDGTKPDIYKTHVLIPVTDEQMKDFGYMSGDYVPPLSVPTWREVFRSIAYESRYRLTSAWDVLRGHAYICDEDCDRC